MSFYYLQEEMGLVLNDILDKVCSKNRENLKNDIAITWINYKSENNNIYKGFGFGINNKKLIYPASIVKLVYGLAAYSWIETKKILLRFTNKKILNFRMAIEFLEQQAKYIVYLFFYCYFFKAG